MPSKRFEHPEQIKSLLWYSSFGVVIPSTYSILSTAFCIDSFVALVCSSLISQAGQGTRALADAVETAVATALALARVRDASLILG